MALISGKTLFEATLLCVCWTIIRQLEGAWVGICKLFGKPLEEGMLRVGLPMCIQIGKGNY